MGIGFKVAPGVRIRASSRGISAGVGPRAARVHVGTRGVGVSSGVGPISGYTHLGGGGSRKSSGGTTRRASYGGPTKASIAAREREAKAAKREADIESVKALEQALVSVHKETFPPATRIVIPGPEEVDPASIQAHLEETAGIPALVQAIGGGEQAPVAAAPDPVDRYEQMREHRKRARAGVSIWSLKKRIEAAQRADREADEAASREVVKRADAQRAEQAHLDELWTELNKARAVVSGQLAVNVEAERARRAERHAADQAEVDLDWKKLQSNDPEVTLTALEQAFADNEAPAAAIDCEGDHTTVVMQFVKPESIIPEKKPSRTPTGKRTLKKRTKTEINALYLQALGSNVLATVKEAFAVAPGTHSVQTIVVREEEGGSLGVIYLGRFDRSGYAALDSARDPARSLEMAEDVEINLRGRTEEVTRLGLSGRKDLSAVVTSIERGLAGR